MKKLIVFDLDGTLNQTNLYAVEAVRMALADFGVTGYTDEEIQSHFGERPADYTKTYFPNASEEVRNNFLKAEARHEDQLLEQYGKPFDGIPEVLSKLKQQGYLLAVCSNSSIRYISLVLKTLKIDSYMDYLQPLLPGMIKDDTLKILLEQVNPDSAVMVGDRIYDQNAAKANHIPFIGCAYGYNPKEMESADFVAHSPMDILNGVEALF
ncbi:MAG: HAD family hydrolase [Massiliimalia sp.]